AARAGSRRHLARVQPQIMDVNPAAVAAALELCDAQLLIHGHTHRPGVHEHRIGDRVCRRVVLDAWYDGGSCLWLEADGRLSVQRWRAGMETKAAIG
ncbi:MAG: hypothetical protein NZM12_08255, partial [Steroidobacteraceae bacterium]|nr:hypothetical protein [Steroidobacteraceae bacterium]